MIIWPKKFIQPKGHLMTEIDWNCFSAKDNVSTDKHILIFKTTVNRRRIWLSRCLRRRTAPCYFTRNLCEVNVCLQTKSVFITHFLLHGAWRQRRKLGKQTKLYFLMNFSRKSFRPNNLFFEKIAFGQMTFWSNDLSVIWHFGQTTFRSNAPISKFFSVKLHFCQK
jgi:hypothetical protein